MRGKSHHSQPGSSEVPSNADSCIEEIQYDHGDIFVDSGSRYGIPRPR
jgi:hypothetical protein